MNAPRPVAPWRLFLGLWPPAAVAAALQDHAARWHWPDAARRTRPERLHATLHFIGDVAVERLPSVQQALDCDWPGCELVLDRATVWPGGIAVLEASAVPPALTQLHECLGRALAGLDLPLETRRYRPHVTFARQAQGARPPAGFEAIVWPVAPGYVLVRSLPGGYLAVHRYGAAAGAG